MCAVALDANGTRRTRARQFRAAAALLLLKRRGEEEEEWRGRRTLHCSLQEGGGRSSHHRKEILSMQTEQSERLRTGKSWDDGDDADAAAGMIGGTHGTAAWGPGGRGLLVPFGRCRARSEQPIKRLPGRAMQSDLLLLLLCLGSRLGSVGL